ncbi:MAG: hypothetical protein A2Y11_04000 [Planctomycetes bacterium GWC2_39_26]|nr:MAG: hypothetical protein A2Y11_04000 [Planctomycetes bacterium GWC2_39_26]
MPFSINLPLTMSIERIRKHIIENAQKEAEQIIKTAEEQFSAQVDVAKVSIEKQYHETLQKEEERFKEDMKRAISTLKTDYKMRLLEIKNSLVDDVISHAINRIQLLNDDDYLALLKKWLSNIPDHLEGQLFVNAMDFKRIADNFIGSINKGRKAKIILNKTAIEIKGGFILKTKHYEIDYTLDTIVKNLRTTLIPKLNDMLRLSDVEL